jgi:hypothetical protein
MTAKLVQSVNDRSLSRYWKKRLRARSKRSDSTRSYRNRALPSAATMRSGREPEAKSNQRERLVDDEVGRDQGSAGLERRVTGGDAGHVCRIAPVRTGHPTAGVDVSNGEIGDRVVKLAHLPPLRSGRPVKVGRQDKRSRTTAGRVGTGRTRARDLPVAPARHGALTSFLTLAPLTSAM